MSAFSDKDVAATRKSLTDTTGLVVDKEGVPLILSGPYPGTAEWHAEQKKESTIPEDETDEQRDAREKAVVKRILKEAYWPFEKPQEGYVWFQQKSKRPATDDDLHRMAKKLNKISKVKAFVTEDAVETQWGYDYSKNGWVDDEKFQAMRTLEAFTRPSGPTEEEARVAFERIENAIVKEAEFELELKEKRRQKQQRRQSGQVGADESDSEAEPDFQTLEDKYPGRFYDPKRTRVVKTPPPESERDPDTWYYQPHLEAQGNVINVDDGYNTDEIDISEDEGFSSSRTSIASPGPLQNSHGPDGGDVLNMGDISNL